ncbi:MAG: hypothetical protein ACLQOZ_08950 [Acidimicrobiales bacterium]|jgi:hypothetical protein
MPPGDDEVARLHSENAELRSEVGGRRDSETAPGHRARRVSAWVVLVVACLLAVVSVLVVFVRNEALNTDTYVSTVQPLADDPAIQTAVASKVADALLAKVDVEQKVANALPSQAGFLVTPITSGLDAAVNQITLRFVQSKAFQTLWAQANRRAHQQLVNLLTGATTGAVSSNGGQVTLDLGTVAAEAKKQLAAHGITIFDKVPTGNGPDLVLFKSAQLAKAQRLTRALNRLALVLPILTVLLFAGSVLLALDRRRGFVRATTGLGISMALMLVASDFSRDQYLHAVANTLPLAAAAASYDIVTADPLGTIRAILVVSLIAALIGAALGNARLRAGLGALEQPAWMVDGPVIRFVTTYRKALQWTVVGVGALILFTWVNPTPLVVVVLALVVLAVGALIGFAARRPA